MDSVRQISVKKRISKFSPSKTQNFTIKGEVKPRKLMGLLRRIKRTRGRSNGASQNKINWDNKDLSMAFTTRERMFSTRSNTNQTEGKVSVLLKWF